MKTHLTLTAALLGLALTPAAGAETYVPPLFDGRVGKIFFHNSSRYPVTVTLRHPDSGTVFARCRLKGGESAFLTENGQPIHVGSDWGIQIGDSEIKSVGKVSAWIRAPENEHVWSTSVQRFHGD